MLTWLTKGVRSRAAFALVLSYVICVLAPAASFALGDAKRAAHCITDDHRGAVPKAHAHSGSESSHVHADAASSHAHANDAAHEHASTGGDKGSLADAKCCGLMCLPAIPATVADLPDRLPAAVPMQFVAAHLTGRGPESLSRPPDSSLSL